MMIGRLLHASLTIAVFTVAVTDAQTSAPFVPSAGSTDCTGQLVEYTGSWTGHTVTAMHRASATQWYIAYTTSDFGPYLVMYNTSSGVETPIANQSATPLMTTAITWMDFNYAMGRSSATEFYAATGTSVLAFSLTNHGSYFVQFSNVTFNRTFVTSAWGMLTGVLFDGYCLWEYSFLPSTMAPSDLIAMGGDPTRCDGTAAGFYNMTFNEPRGMILSSDRHIVIADGSVVNFYRWQYTVGESIGTGITEHWVLYAPATVNALITFFADTKLSSPWDAGGTYFIVSNDCAPHQITWDADLTPFLDYHTWAMADSPTTQCAPSIGSVSTLDLMMATIDGEHAAYVTFASGATVLAMPTCMTLPGDTGAPPPWSSDSVTTNASSTTTDVFTTTDTTATTTTTWQTFPDTGTASTTTTTSSVTFPDTGTAATTTSTSAVTFPDTGTAATTTTTTTTVPFPDTGTTPPPAVTETSWEPSFPDTTTTDTTTTTATDTTWTTEWATTNTTASTTTPNDPTTTWNTDSATTSTTTAVSNASTATVTSTTAPGTGEPSTTTASQTNTTTTSTADASTSSTTAPTTTTTSALDPALEAVIRLVGSGFGLLLADAARRNDLERAVKLDLAGLLAVAEEFVTIVDMYEGSLVVNFTVGSGTSVASDVLATQLNTATTNDAWLGGIAAVYATVSNETLTTQIESVVIPPSVSPTSDSGNAQRDADASSGDGALSPEAATGVGVGVGVVVLIAAVVGGVVIVRAKTRRAGDETSPHSSTEPIEGVVVGGGDAGAEQEMATLEPTAITVRADKDPEGGELHHDPYDDDVVAVDSSAVGPFSDLGVSTAMTRSTLQSQASTQQRPSALGLSSVSVATDVSVARTPLRRLAKIKRQIAEGLFSEGKLLGRGANGAVFSALLQDGSTVAMKEIGLSGDEAEVASQLAEVQREVDLLTQLEHPNLVQYFGMHCDRRRMHVRVFMEVVTGGSLGALVRGMGEPLNERLGQVYVRQVVEGLAYVHSRHVVHRDLKCDNVLRDANSGTVLLADFGTARILDRTTCRSHAAQTMIGTPLFMAPEVLAIDRVPDAVAANLDGSAAEAERLGYGMKADVWSLGIAVAELMDKGDVPWPKFVNPMHAMMHIGGGGRPRWASHFSAGLIEFLEACTTADPRARPTAAELLRHPWIADVPVSLDE